MASRLIFSLLLFTISVTTTTSTTTTTTTTTTTSAIDIAPTPSPSSPPPKLSVLAPSTSPAQIQEPPQQKQFNAIIESVVGAGNFGYWADLLSQADPSFLPLTATLFVPENGGNPFSPVDPLLLPYHIVPRKLSFTELRRLPNGARLPTLLPDKTLVITNISASNFSVNGVAISHPDLFQSSVVSVHGIGTLLDFAEETSSENLKESPDNSMSPRITVSRLGESLETSMGPRLSISLLGYLIVLVGYYYLISTGDIFELLYVGVLVVVIYHTVPAMVVKGVPLAVRFGPFVLRGLLAFIVQTIVEVIIEVVKELIVPVILQYLRRG